MMVSDIVLLKELPDIIRNSVEAYVGCIAGAAIKTEYIKTIKEAGFQNVVIIDETSFPLECMTNDPSAQAIIKDLAISLQRIEEITKSIVSVKISAVKPNSSH